jgi:hypothetical protein
MAENLAYRELERRRQAVRTINLSQDKKWDGMITVLDRAIKRKKRRKSTGGYNTGERKVS